VKKEREREVSHVTHLDVVHHASLPYVVVVCPLLVATSLMAMWPLLLVWKKEKGRGAMLLTCSGG
jgi:hypothetical protein